MDPDDIGAALHQAHTTRLKEDLINNKIAQWQKGYLTAEEFAGEIAVIVYGSEVSA